MTRAPSIGVVLSGCGFQDGTEIQEAVITMLALQELGAATVCVAPDRPQTTVTDHLTGQAADEPRSVLIESARIARGQVRRLADVSPSDFDAVVIPGGFGAALNLCDFAKKGAAMTVDPDLEKLLLGVHEAGKPIGALCIAPVILARLFGRLGARLTIGNDAGIVRTLEGLGAVHVTCKVDGIVVDEKNRLVTTPAYMLGESVKDIHLGIRRLAEDVVRLVNAHKKG